MKVTLHSSQSGRQVALHLALVSATDEYDRVHAEVQAHPPLTEETADPFLTNLWYRWEQPFMAKLTTVPKQFDEKYELPESSELYRDLKRLHERRNALMHLKEA